ncbi:hypothetical protein Z946_1792 [Sulfitobacter noctilucicola]|nr:hypothetical protein Z946_1792 [Sulfitobacter noctilucicola]
MAKVEHGGLPCWFGIRLQNSAKQRQYFGQGFAFGQSSN